MVGCGLACPGGGGAGVSGCEFRGSGWGWDRRCQDPGARGLGPGGGGFLEDPYHLGGGGSNTEHGISPARSEAHHPIKAWAVPSLV